MSKRIPYTQTWEDTDILRRALAIHNNDRVLTITAAGGAPVAVLLDRPRELVSIDRSASQTRLVQLIAVAAEALSYEKFLAFIGISDSPDRVTVFHARLSSIIDPEDVQFWNERLGDIAQGIIHAGKLEKYFQLFSRYVVPLLVTPETVRQLFQSQTLKEQADLYYRAWDSWRWQLGLKMFYGKELLHRYGRDRVYHKHARVASGTIYARRAVRGLTQIPVQTNWIAEYILTGRYRHTIPPYYGREAWQSWQRLRRDGQLHTGDIVEQLPTLGMFTKVHLSDIVEGFSAQQFREFFTQLAKHVAPGGRVCFWVNLSQPPINTLPEFGFRILHDESSKLWREDNGFIYDNFFILERVDK